MLPGGGGLQKCDWEEKREGDLVPTIFADFFQWLSQPYKSFGQLNDLATRGKLEN